MVDMSITDPSDKKRAVDGNENKRGLRLGPINANETIVESYLVSNGNELNLISYHRYWKKDLDLEDDEETENYG